jgi:hypothetical protein
MNALGKGIRWVGGTNDYIQLDADADNVLDTVSCSMLIATVRNATNNGNDISYGYEDGGTGNRVQAHFPLDTTATIYWDFGNGTGGVGGGRVTANPGAATWAIGRINIWGFYAGSRGREIWLNGRLIASDITATKIRSATTQGFRIGSGASNSSSASAPYHSDNLFVLSKEGWSQAAFAGLTANPWRIFEPKQVTVFAAPYPPTVIGLTAPTLGLTPQDIAQTRTQNLTAAALTLTPNSVTALWTIRPATADFAFNREVFQIASANNLGVSTCDFTALEISAQSVASLGTAAMDFVANDVQLAITNNLDVGNLILAGQDTQQVASTTLGTATMDFVGKNITEIQVVALGSAALNFTAQTSNPVAVVTLSTAAMNMVVLDIRPENSPLGTVQVMTISAMDFAVNPISNTASTTLSAAAMNDVAYELHLVSSNVLTAPTFDLAPQPLTVTQAAVVVALVPATFDFVPGAIQAAGTSSVGDRRRIMMGVGK